MRMVPLRAAAVVAIALLTPLVTAASADVPFATDETVAQKATAQSDDPSSLVIGNPHASVAVIESFDYACPHNCKATEPRLESLIKADKGTKLVLKEFPILTPASLIATKAALASVKQGKYAQFHEALMNYRGTLDTSVIFDTAKSVGLDVTRLRKDMAAPEINEAIIASFNLALSFRVFQRPGFIVGNHILTGPPADMDFRKAVAMARAK